MTCENDSTVAVLVVKKEGLDKFAGCKISSHLATWRALLRMRDSYHIRNNFIPELEYRTEKF